jgi:hypothetical protein
MVTCAALGPQNATPSIPLQVTEKEVNLPLSSHKGKDIRGTDTLILYLGVR